MRHLASFISALSLALLALTCAAWARSYFEADVVRRNVGPCGFQVISTRGNLAMAELIGTRWSDESRGLIRVRGQRISLWYYWAGASPSQFRLFGGLLFTLAQNVTLGLTAPTSTPISIPSVSADRLFIIPHFVVAAGFSLLPLAWTIQRLLRRRTLPGTCPACGYDLRATPDRCPECGRRIAAV